MAAPDQNPKFKRSKDRCGVVTRIPVFDQSGQTLCYSIRYTAGENYKAKSLEPKHVMHVLVGYYVRRAVNLFVGDHGNAMVSMPITPDILKYSQLMPNQRFILHLPQKQEVTPSNLHVLSLLRKVHMRVAADVYTIIYTRWAQALKNFSYAIIDMEGDVLEQLHLAHNIKVQAPWIKLIAANIPDPDYITSAFSAGIDYAAAPFYPVSLQKKRISPVALGKAPQLLSDVCSVVMELFSANPDHNLFLELMHRYPAVNSFYMPFIEFMQLGPEPREAGAQVELFHFMDLEEALITLDFRMIEVLVTSLSLRLLESFFEAEENAERGIMTYEPFKTALLRGQMVVLLAENLESLENRDNLPLFTMGACIHMESFAPEGAGDTTMMFKELQKLIKADIDANAQLSGLYEIITGLEVMDLDRVLLAAEKLKLTERNLTSTYEKAMIWAEQAVKIMGKWL